MVDFVAKMPVDMSDLAELGELHDWDNLQAPNTKIAVSKFTATLKSDEDIQYKFKGNNLTLLGEVPSGGTVKKIAVLDDKSKVYEISDLSITFLKNRIEDTFDNNFEKSLFDDSDSIEGSSGDDVLVGYAGNDRLKGKDGSDALRGKKGGDKLLGNSGNDDINGNKGNDKLNGGTGNDLLSGGGGKNTFIFKAQLNAVTNVETVTDFVIGKDTMKLDSSVFIGIGPDGTLSSGKFVDFGTPVYPEDVIVYDQGTGSLFYDGDGSGGEPPVLFGKVTAGLDLRPEDFVVFS